MRKTVLHPFTLAFLFVSIGSAIAGQVALSILGLLLAIVSVAVLSMRETQALRDEGTMSDLSNEERSQLAPLRKLRNEIAQIVEAKRGEVSITVVGAEAIHEADRILEQCTKLVRLRKELKKSLFSHASVAKELASLESDVEGAQSDVERETLRQALEARRLEAAHYGSAQEAMSRIEANLRQAEAALSEMKARLATTATPSEQAEQTGELEETIGRLKSLGSSLEEAESWLKGQA